MTSCLGRRLRGCEGEGVELLLETRKQPAKSVTLAGRLGETLLTGDEELVALEVPRWRGSGRFGLLGSTLTIALDHPGRTIVGLGSLRGRVALAVTLTLLLASKVLATPLLANCFVALSLLGSELLLDLAEVATRLTVVVTGTHCECVYAKEGGGLTLLSKKTFQFFVGSL